MHNTLIVFLRVLGMLFVTSLVSIAQEQQKSSYSKAVSMLHELKGKPSLEISGQIILLGTWKHLQKNNSVSGKFEGKSDSSDLWKSILIFLNEHDYELWTGPKLEGIASAARINVKVTAENKEHQIRILGSRIFEIDDELFMAPEGGMVSWEFFIAVLLKFPQEWHYIE